MDNLAAGSSQAVFSEAGAQDEPKAATNKAETAKPSPAARKSQRSARPRQRPFAQTALGAGGPIDRNEVMVRPGGADSYPTYARRVELKTTQMQNAWNHTYQRFKTTIFYVHSKMLHANRNDALAAFDQFLKALIASGRDEIEQELKRLAEVARRNGVTVPQLEYPKATSVDARIGDPAMLQMCELFLAGDRLIAQIDAHGIVGLLSVPERIDEQKRWFRFVNKVGGKVQAVVQSLQLDRIDNETAKYAAMLNEAREKIGTQSSDGSDAENHGHDEAGVVFDDQH